MVRPKLLNAISSAGGGACAAAGAAAADCCCLWRCVSGDGTIDVASSSLGFAKPQPLNPYLDLRLIHLFLLELAQSMFAPFMRSIGGFMRSFCGLGTVTRGAFSVDESMFEACQSVKAESKPLSRPDVQGTLRANPPAV